MLDFHFVALRKPVLGADLSFRHYARRVCLKTQLDIEQTMSKTILMLVVVMCLRGAFNNLST